MKSLSLAPILILFSIFFSVGLLMSKDIGKCIRLNDSKTFRNNFTQHESIEGDNFKVHFTTSSVDSQYVNNQWMSLESNLGYAESILHHAESALLKYLAQGWENVPPDCDESISNLDSPGHCINFGGDSKYDIYISNDAAGMVVPENPYPVPPYTGGYTSFMKISTLLNQYQELPSWSYHVVAHELHHSIQLRYGYSVSGEFGNYIYNGWFFEQSATYMENVIYPESIHLKTMLANCNVVTPLTYPEHGIDYQYEIYPYRSALWQKFLVESLGDSSIVRYLWEDYGVKYASGGGVSLFPIYSDGVSHATDGIKSLDEAYGDYSIWRYFTGSRAAGSAYFNEASSYCTSSTISSQDSLFSLGSNKGSSRYINLPSEDRNFVLQTDYPEDINIFYLKAQQGSNVDIESLSAQGNSFYFSTSPNSENVLLVNSNYNDNDSMELSFSISSGHSDLDGDVNMDGTLDVLDVVNLVNQIFADEYDSSADINNDDQVDVLDVVVLVNLILI